MGHLALVDGGEGDGGVSVGGVGVGQPPPQAVVTVERTRMRATRSKALDAIGDSEKKTKSVFVHSAS